jgi:hypothetical protein
MGGSEERQPVSFSYASANSTRKAGAMQKPKKVRATQGDVQKRISHPGTIARIPKVLADRTRLDEYERTPPPARFVGLVHGVGEAATREIV